MSTPYQNPCLSSHMNNHYRLHVLIAGVFVSLESTHKVQPQGNLCHFYSMASMGTPL
uniref:Uncharacterized protein n=1 Tax=Myoviridae sp. ctwmI4 TaxID=2826710 RepID=A0A8S5LUM4_9CAUD|nr:MAG TPA: hypothetical protein [Myoviridae sp. ctwmI4]